MNFIQSHSGAISPEVCSQIIKNYNARQIETGERTSSNLLGAIREYTVDESCISSEIQESIAKVAEAKIQEYLSKVPELNMKSYFLNHMTIMFHSEFKNIGYHYDSEYLYMNDAEYIRNFAVLIYLNQDFDGGELMFPLQKTVIKPQTGLMLIFPTSFMYPHVTNPAMGDDRYVLRLSYFFKKEILIKNARESKVYT
jgi:hypothetical protein